MSRLYFIHDLARNLVWGHDGWVKPDAAGLVEVAKVAYYASNEDAAAALAELRVPLALRMIYGDTRPPFQVSCCELQESKESKESKGSP
jgi:hypothetical protein